MSAGRQLRLVEAGARMVDALVGSSDPVAQVFEHWAFMFGKSVERVKLGPVRRRAIAGALAMGYTVAELKCAVDGVAADPMERLNEEAREHMRKLSWFLADEERIDQYVERGEALGERMRAIQCDAQRVREVPAVNAADAAAARERLRALAQACRQGGRG